MKTIELSTATRPLAEYAGEIGDEMVVLTNHSKPVAAIVSLKHIDSESLALSMLTQTDDDQRCRPGRCGIGDPVSCAAE